MTEANKPLEAIQDIKQMMERSSRFISLSGWSGIAAGCCALAGAAWAYSVIGSRQDWLYTTRRLSRVEEYDGPISLQQHMGSKLFMIAVFTFVAAFVLAFLFTYLRSRRNGAAIWSSTSRRLLVNVSIPMIVGGVYLLKLIETGTFGLIAPGCLIFYGLALVNGSKYTIGEVRYLGYGQIILGLLNCWFIGYGLYFWALGFGVLHIVYGAMMWWKYERV
jgi:hypothetical protein